MNRAGGISESTICLTIKQIENTTCQHCFITQVAGIPQEAFEYLINGFDPSEFITSNMNLSHYSWFDLNKGQFSSKNSTEKAPLSATLFLRRYLAMELIVLWSVMIGVAVDFGLRLILRTRYAWRRSKTLTEGRQTMKNALTGIINLIGRLLLASVFLLTALISKIPDFHHVADQMAQEGVPFPKVMLAGAIVFLLAGSLSLMAGFKARIGAALLLIFTISGTYYFHHFWTFTEPALIQEQLKVFMKNMSIIGGLLMIVANGPGAFSIDAKHSEKKHEP